MQAEEDDDGIDRSAWLQKALRKHPEIQNLRERYDVIRRSGLHPLVMLRKRYRIYPVSRAVAFGRTYNAPTAPETGRSDSSVIDCPTMLKHFHKMLGDKRTLQKSKGTAIIPEDMLFFDKTKIMQLIMQHLYHEGLKHSAQVLSSEANVACTFRAGTNAVSGRNP